MEELQDAIEDAQYVNAISSVDDGPRPVLPWDIPEEEELASWKEGVIKNEAASSKQTKEGKQPAKTQPTPFEFEWTLAHALGFFLFSAYLKDSVGEHVEINFMEEVLRWKGTRGRFRAEKTSFIVANYLSPLPEGSLPMPKLDSTASTSDSSADVEQPAVTPAAPTTAPIPPAAGGQIAPEVPEENGPASNGESSEHVEEGAPSTSPQEPPPKKATPIGPPKTEIDEYDMAREPTKISAEEIQEIRTNNSDPTKNCIGVGGQVLDKILTRVDKLRKAPGYSSLPEIRESSEEQNDGIPNEQPGQKKEEVKKQRSLRNLSLVSNELPENLFDEAEIIVAENVRERHWTGFQASEHHAKLLNFLWFQDRTVVEEDFFVMRVLGRGGFGLVTGE